MLSIDTVVAQFQHLDQMVQRFCCIGIEMETSAVFPAAGQARPGQPARAYASLQA